MSASLVNEESMADVTSSAPCPGVRPVRPTPRPGSWVSARASSVSECSVSECSVSECSVSAVGSKFQLFVTEGNISAPRIRQWR